jgi:hypothetical protein
MIALALVLAASDCGGCHPVARAQWAQSRHATSARNPLYVSSTLYPVGYFAWEGDLPVRGGVPKSYISPATPK